MIIMVPLAYIASRFWQTEYTAYQVHTSWVWHLCATCTSPLPLR